MNLATNPLATPTAEYDSQGLEALLNEAFSTKLRLPEAALSPKLHPQLAALRRTALTLFGQKLLGTGPQEDEQIQMSTALQFCSFDSLPLSCTMYGRDEHFVLDIPYSITNARTLCDKMVAACTAKSPCNEDKRPTDSDSSPKYPHTPDCNQENLAADWGGEAELWGMDSHSHSSTNYAEQSIMHSEVPVQDTVKQVASNTVNSLAHTVTRMHNQTKAALMESTPGHRLNTLVKLTILGVLLFQSANTPWLLILIALAWAWAVYAEILKDNRVTGCWPPEADPELPGSDSE